MQQQVYWSQQAEGTYRRGSRIKVERERVIEYAEKIMDLGREELAGAYPFLTPAIYALKPVASPECGMNYGLGRGADTFIYDPEELVEDFVKGKDTTEIFLHSILHCLFLHPFAAAYHKDQELWNLSCDICIRDIMLRLGRCRSASEDDIQRTSIIDGLKRSLPYLNADWIYGSFPKESIPADLFRIDDHALWCPQETRNSKSDRRIPNEDHSRKKWENIAGEIELALKRSLRSSNERGDIAGYFIEVLTVIERRHTDYDAFLKHFGVYDEIPRLDPECFDISFYTYGLELYGDMPLIEPLEYTERRTVREFAVAIDTSQSCSMELIRHFLEKTYDILFASLDYGERKKMVIFQCDSEIQSETVISDREELEKYMSEIAIHGRGGTDFRPVFKRIEELENEKFFTGLRGLLYFTDGDGVFPEIPPKYKTAFVMPYSGAGRNLPPWAMKVMVEA